MNNLRVNYYLEEWAKDKAGHLYPAVPKGAYNGAMKQIALRKEFVKHIMDACNNFCRGKFDRAAATKYFLDKGFSNFQVFEMFDILGL